MNAIFVESVRRDTFKYLIEILDNETEEAEVHIIFENGELHSVDTKQIGSLSQEIHWELMGVVSQLVENCKRSLREPIEVKAQPKKEVQPKEEVPEIPAPENNGFKRKIKWAHPKITEDKVIYWRRYFRNPKHRGIVVSSIAKKLGITGTSAQNFLVGKTWSHVTEEPPLTTAEYKLAQAYPSTRFNPVRRKEDRIREILVMKTQEQ